MIWFLYELSKRDMNLRDMNLEPGFQNSASSSFWNDQLTWSFQYSFNEALCEIRKTLMFHFSDKGSFLIKLRLNIQLSILKQIVSFSF